MLKWLKWYFYQTRRCAHERGEGRLVNMGMNKTWHCRKCGKCLEFL